MAVVDDAFAVVDGERVRDCFPAVGPPGHVLTVLASSRRHEVEDLERGLLVREVPPMSARFSEPRVQRRDRVVVYTIL